MMSPQQQRHLSSSQEHTFSTINHNQISSQLGFQSGMANVQQHRNSTRSNYITPAIIETSSDSDDSTPLAQLIGNKKHLSPDPIEPPAVKAAKKSKGKKKKKDPNEPQKPVSAYALFFRDTQAVIKGQTPNATFGEVSKIVASMWDSLDIERKNSYKKKAETDKKEYLKSLADYRANLVSKSAVNQSDAVYSNSSPTASVSPRSSPPGHITSMPKQPSPVLNSIPESMQPVTNNFNVYPQEMWPVQSPPQSNISPQNVMPEENNISAGIISQKPVYLNSSSPMSTPASNSPSYNQSMASMSPGNHPTMNNINMTAADPICLRNGCSNLAIESLDWDKEYCSNQCVVLHCKDVFANWVVQRQLHNPNQFSTVN